MNLPAWASTLDSVRALPRWAGYVAAAAATIMLALFVATVQASVKRGESLQQARQAASTATIGSRNDNRRPVAGPDRR